MSLLPRKQRLREQADEDEMVGCIHISNRAMIVQTASSGQGGLSVFAYPDGQEDPAAVEGQGRVLGTQ